MPIPRLRASAPHPGSGALRAPLYAGTQQHQQQLMQFCVPSTIPQLPPAYPLPFNGYGRIKDQGDKCENLVNLIDEALLHRVSDVVSSIQLTKPEVSSNPTLD